MKTCKDLIKSCIEAGAYKQVYSQQIKSLLTISYAVIVRSTIAGIMGKIMPVLQVLVIAKN